MTKKDFDTIVKLLNDAGCDWSVEYDNHGQVVIYTGVDENGEPIDYEGGE